jgi:hypothetical protein
MNTQTTYNVVVTKTGVVVDTASTRKQARAFKNEIHRAFGLKRKELKIIQLTTKFVR